MITLAAIPALKALAILLAGSLMLALLCCVCAGFLSNRGTWNDRGTNDDDDH